MTALLVFALPFFLYAVVCVTYRLGRALLKGIGYNRKPRATLTGLPPLFARIEEKDRP